MKVFAVLLAAGLILTASVRHYTRSLEAISRCLSRDATVATGVSGLQQTGQFLIVHRQGRRRHPIAPHVLLAAASFSQMPRPFVRVSDWVSESELADSGQYFLPDRPPA